MFFDKIIINPPYSTTGGGMIQLKICSFASICVSLSPYYVDLTAYNHIIDFQKLNYRNEFDAVLTNSCISVLSNKIQNKYSYQDIEFLGYDERYIEFYKVNYNLDKTVEIKCSPPPKFYEYAKNHRDKFLITSMRFISTGFPKSGMMVDFYNGKEVDFIRNTRDKETKGNIIEFSSKKARDNYYIFLSKGTIENNLLLGLNKSSGNPNLAIPRIDWEKISDTELWKQEKYDEAVLSVMGLKLENDVVKRV